MLAYNAIASDRNQGIKPTAISTLFTCVTLELSSGFRQYAFCWGVIHTWEVISRQRHATNFWQCAFCWCVIHTWEVISRQIHATNLWQYAFCWCVIHTWEVISRQRHATNSRHCPRLIQLSLQPSPVFRQTCRCDDFLSNRTQVLEIFWI